MVEICQRAKMFLRDENSITGLRQCYWWGMT